MDILVAVAFDARVASVGVSTCGVALLARHGDMQAHQREFRQVVVEIDDG